jgi:hypothetical protein
MLLDLVGVQHQGFEVVAHGFDVDVLVDQFDGLRAKRARAACRCRWAASRISYTWSASL